MRTPEELAKIILEAPGNKDKDKDKEINYKRAWVMLIEKLVEAERFGNMFQQSVASAYLDAMHEIEDECSYSPKSAAP